MQRSSGHNQQPDKLVNAVRHNREADTNALFATLKASSPSSSLTTSNTKARARQQPGRPAHIFSYTTRNQLETYTLLSARELDSAEQSGNPAKLHPGRRKGMSKMNTLWLRQASQRLLVALAAGFAVAVFYFLLGLLELLTDGEPLEKAYFILLAYFLVGVFVLSLVSALLARIYFSIVGLHVPPAGKIAWGIMLGLTCCMLADLPDLNFPRWRPYLAAASAGLLAAAVNHRMRNNSRSVGSTNGESRSG